MIIRPALPSDAEGMAAVLTALVAAGKRDKPSDAGFVLSNYIAHPDRIQCHVAVDAQGRVLGFQSLRRVRDRNIYDTPIGWGMIGTHISPQAARSGVGKALFAATHAVALTADIPAMEAFIGATNAAGIAYYTAMGFREYRQAEGAFCTSFELSAGAPASA